MTIELKISEKSNVRMRKNVGVKNQSHEYSGLSSAFWFVCLFESLNIELFGISDIEVVTFRGGASVYLQSVGFGIE